jgi:hypothetical protein
VTPRYVVSVQPMKLSDGRTDFFVSIRSGDREVTLHVFREEYKAAYHVALYEWLLNGAEEPDLVAFDEKDWPAKRIDHAPAPPTQTQPEPDYCFDPDNWEFTCHWSDRDQVHGHGDALNSSEPMRVATLMKGPDKWVADVPVTWDENGDPDETEVKWFSTEEEARAVLTTEGQP